MKKEKHPIIDGKKTCGTCGITKPISEFYKYKNGLRSYCKKCNAENVTAFRNNPLNSEKVSEYSRKHYNKPGVKEKKQKAATEWLLSNKKKAVEYKGGCCSICGYNKCLSALEFHHKNPKEKEYNKDNRGLNRKQSFRKAKKELDKCILVCANCHREIHNNNMKNE